MSFKDFFSHQAETRERHRDSQLRTRYYKVSRNKALEAVRSLLEKDSRIKLLSYSEEHGEITAEYIKPKKAFLVATIIMVFPHRTAIDFTLTTKTGILPMDFGFSKQEVLKLYRQLDQQLSFAGVGLSAEG